MPPIGGAPGASALGAAGNHARLAALAIALPARLAQLADDCTAAADLGGRVGRCLTGIAADLGGRANRLHILVSRAAREIREIRECRP